MPARTSSDLRLTIEQTRRGLDHSLAMLDNPAAITTNKIDLMLATLFAQRTEVLDRMGAGNLRDEFTEQVRFGSNPVEDLVADEDRLFKHHFLHTEHEIQGTLV